MRSARWALVLAVGLAVACPLLAGEKKGGKGREKKPPKCPAAERVERMLQGVTLTDDQKAKLDEVKKEFGPKLAETMQKIDSVLTDEQKKARAEAATAAKAAGKKGKEMAQAIEEALKLTDEQKTKMAELKKQMGELEKSLREKVISVLTPEQKDQLKKAHQHKKAAK